MYKYPGIFRIPPFKHSQLEKMDRLLQLAVLIVTIASCYSYSLQRHDPQMPEESYLDVEYPTEYIEKLVNALSSEELQRIRNIIDLQHRDSIPSSSNCEWYSHESVQRQGKDVTGTEYFIAHSHLLPSIIIQKCNTTMKHHCTDEYNYRSTRSNCCVADTELRTVPVASVSVTEYYQNIKSKKSTNDTVITRDLYIKSRCACKSIILDENDLKYDEDMICKLLVEQ